MKDHYAVARFDAKGHLESLRVRINNFGYTFEVRDNGEGERELFMHLASQSPMGERRLQTFERAQKLEQAQVALKRMYGKSGTR